MTVNYSDIYNTANKMFLHSSEGRVLPSVHYMNQFYKQADDIQDCFAKKRGIMEKDTKMYSTAKMALQQAYADTLEVITDDYAEQVIDNEMFAQKTKNVAMLMLEMQNSSQMKELDKKIKQTHRKTGNKRLAIQPCLMDSYSTGLGMVRHSKGFEKTDTLLYKIASYLVVKMNPAVVSLEEEVVENKGMKKLLYFVRKLHLG